MEYINFFDSLADKLEELVSCSATCKYLWDGFGRWKNEQWIPYLKGWNDLFRQNKKGALSKHSISDRLAQLAEHRTAVREVAGSNLGRTNTQGL